jgi:2-dehydropantoate 2-reductase
MRIAIIGTGGLGSYYGSLLVRAGEDVIFVARGAQLDAIRSNGLTLRMKNGDDTIIPAKVTDDPGTIGLVDLVIFCVKTYDTTRVAERIRPCVHPNTIITSIQNGVDNIEIIERIVKTGHFVAGTSYVNAGIISPGVIEVRLERMTLFGRLDGTTSPGLELLVETFLNAGLLSEARQDILIVLWEKFLAMCGTASVEVLTRLPARPTFSCPDTYDLCVRALKEGMEVGRTAGVNISDDYVEKTMDLVTLKIPPAHRPSMYYDLTAGKPLELEALNGTLVQLGRKYGVDTPVNFAIYAALKPWVSGTPVLPD